ncbi:MAG TPA: hypothetical protein VKB86_19475 [Pyrinomonadaceae bacterium]|nr:hypothetical protein [Pyrinomonadaceae bacterium]
MSRPVRALLALICLIALSSLLNAQTPSTKDATPIKAAASKKASASRAEVDPLAEQRRITALSLLKSLADEAKGYRDQTLRARVLARAADALWDSEQDSARTLFKSAWDAAEEADAEAARKMEEEIRRQQQASGSAAVTPPPNIRNEVLRLASKRDRALGEEFLKKMEEARERETATNSLDRGPWVSKPTQAQRLNLATQLVQDGDTEHALQYADPALTSITIDTINFLSALREKDAAAADKRFAALLQLAAIDPQSDANTVSGLSSYVFTPFLYVTFDKDGGSHQRATRRGGSATPPDLPVELRKAFFQVAAQVLLRPLAPPDQDTTSSGRIGKYLIIKRLLPLFERYAPDRFAELGTVMTALSTDVPDGMRTGENRAVTRGITPEDNTRDRMEGLQDRIDRAKSSAERDSIYADMASALAGTGDARARDLVNKIEDSDLRRQTRAYVDYEYLTNALQKKDVQEALRIARSGELTHIQRVWGFTQAARYLLKEERARAIDILEEATAEARRIDASDADRPRAFIAITSVLMEADPARAWDLISEAVKAANSAEDFTGDDGRMSAILRYKNGLLVTNSSAQDFDLLGIFRALAKYDLNRAIDAAKNFTAEAPRANATLAIASAVLEEKQKSGVRGQ